jgi:hypothetical protein
VRQSDSKLGEDEGHVTRAVKTGRGRATENIWGANILRRDRKDGGRV